MNPSMDPKLVGFLQQEWAMREMTDQIIKIETAQKHPETPEQERLMYLRMLRLKN